MLPDAADADADMNADRTGFDFVLMNANVALDENHIPVFVVPGLLTRAGQHSTDMQTGTGMQSGIMQTFLLWIIFGSLFSRSIVFETVRSGDYLTSSLQKISTEN